MEMDIKSVSNSNIDDDNESNFTNRVNQHQRRSKRSERDIRGADMILPTIQG